MRGFLTNAKRASMAITLHHGTAGEECAIEAPSRRFLPHPSRRPSFPSGWKPLLRNSLRLHPQALRVAVELGGVHTFNARKSRLVFPPVHHAGGVLEDVRALRQV